MEKLGKFINVRTGKLDANAADENGQFPFFTCAVQPLRINTATFDCECVLVAGNGDLNVKYYNGKFNAYQRTYIIECKDKEILSPKFLYRFLEKSLRQLRSQTKGGVIQYLRLNDLTDLKIILLPIRDQLYISNILNRAETLLTQRKESIRLLDEYLKSTFLEMFGDNSKLDQLGNNISYLTSGSRGWAKYYSDKGAKFLRIQNIGGGVIRTDNIIYVNPPNSAETERTRVIEGDLIISITADLGRTSVVPKNFGEGYINQHLALIRLNKNINPIYAAYFYNMPFGNNAIQKKNRSAVKAGLNFNDIKSFPILIPPLELQNQFAHIVEKTETLKAQYQTSLKELENLYQSLSQKAFKGELNAKYEELLMAAEPQVEYITSK
ncbi:MAG: restriction endonuclease subunit S [Bacteroidota bacterium]|nr:restriction endonuclease subunit S [Bacteroidota bacterium]